MTDLQTRLTDEVHAVHVTLSLHHNRVEGSVALQASVGGVGALTVLYHSEMARDGLVTNPTVSDMLHEALHMLQELGVCPSNPVL
jgi:hypothetical protein